METPAQEEAEGLVLYRIPDFKGKLRIGQAPEKQMRVKFGDKLRPKSTRQSPIGPITQVERVGPDRQTFVVTMPEGTARYPRGGTIDSNRFRGCYFRLRQSRDYVRRMRTEDEQALAELDERRDAALAALRAVEDERADFVTKAWRRAEKVTNRELIALAEENV
jgi:hypothetical protein